jgi:hypothetical protein
LAQDRFFVDRWQQYSLDALTRPDRDPAKAHPEEPLARFGIFALEWFSWSCKPRRDMRGTEFHRETGGLK